MGKPVWIFLAAWAVAFVGSFAAFVLTPATDFGLAAGWNKVGVFMGWQSVAGALAVVTAVASRRVPRGTRLRWLGLVPLAALLLLLAAFGALVLWANLQRSAPVGAPPAAPVTAPAPVAPDG
ncbi:MAG: hypothetical protein QNJ44_07050 [Rhodobacter sp.]|nr:hypothetical protein [Rhodobacter sp.]